ncbi:phage tail protein [Methylobacterium nodulans]|uniref:Pyocin R2_PP, tail fiber protein, putative n=1 Tax=Methylobacterium nodulans (strain LMG 21967 / CNCM I-2342 / ORS 2060) TaxID=460265 RepID=B8IDP7_METNO|nr:phage tail protein [Methylobacterium nodulans]ACL55619.1 pyocin R2_PP, tail fiber protein, putative [Methylobacterium nodulans ORS 2060]
MSDPLVITLTRPGLAACVRAQGDGLQAVVDRVAVGRGLNTAGTYGGYTPSKDATSLQNEVIRVPLISGSKLGAPGEARFRVLAEVPKTSSPAEYAIREVGFFLTDGTLLALWSDPTPGFVLASKTALSDVALSLDLVLDQIPTGSLTLTVLDPEIPEWAATIAELLATAARTFSADLAQEQRMCAHGIY